MVLRSVLDRVALPALVSICASWPLAAHGQATVEYMMLQGAAVKNTQEVRKILPGAPLPTMDFDGPSEPEVEAPRAPAQEDGAEQVYQMAPSQPSQYEGESADEDAGPVITIYSD